MYKDENHYTLYRRGDIWGYYYYDENNSRHFRSTGRKTKFEAQKVINQRIHDHELRFEPKKAPKNFRDYTQAFFIKDACPFLKERSRAGKNLAPTTIKLYRDTLEKDLHSYFGSLDISDIDVSAITRYEDEMMKKGLAKSTITLRTAVLKDIMEFAKRSGDISENPFDGHLSLSSREKKDRHAFTIEQVAMLLDGKWKNDIAKAMFLWSCMTGMRIGELSALKVGSVSDGIIQVKESYSQDCRIEKDTKNHKSREIPLPEALKESYEILSYKRTPDMLLFSRNGKTHINKNTVYNSLSKRMAECGINDEKLVFHSCRHFFDTYMGLQSGLSPEKVMSVMGHQSLEMYQHYLHVIREDLGEIKEAQDQLTTKLTTVSKNKRS